MRNRVTIILTLILIILFVFVAFKGISILNFRILSISQIKEKNNQLNKKIDEASILTTIDYPDNIEILEETYSDYEIKKQKYEELTQFSEEDKDVYETKQYDISYLWKLIGKYATSRNLTIGVDVQSTGSTEESLYNLNFSVSGTYVNISQFITDLENNSDLYFRIYNFKMQGSGEIISSSFTVKNVNIDPDTLNTAKGNFSEE